MLGDLKQFLDENFGVSLDDELLVHLLWADDLALIANSASGLQKLLDGLFSFCTKSQMIVNEMKTKVMIFGKSPLDTTLNFSFNGKILDVVDKYKYLGVVINQIQSINSNLFREMWEYVADKGTKAVFATKKKYSSAGDIPVNVAYHLFEVYVKPVLSYGCELWSKYQEIHCIERVQLRFIKHLLGVKDTTCIKALYGEMGCFPLYIDHTIRLLKYWYRLAFSEKGTLIYAAYHSLRNLQLSGFNTWLGKVVTLLEKVNMSHLWYNECENQEQIEHIIHKIVPTLLKDIFIEHWKTTICEQPVLRTYTRFKKEFCLESYMTNIRDKKLRKL